MENEKNELISEIMRLSEEISRLRTTRIITKDDSLKKEISLKVRERAKAKYRLNYITTYIPTTNRESTLLYSLYNEKKYR